MALLDKSSSKDEQNPSNLTWQKNCWIMQNLNPQIQEEEFSDDFVAELE